MRITGIKIISVLFAFLLVGVNLTAQIKLQNGEDYILQTFKTYNIIGISENHAQINSNDFYLKLLSNKDFQNTVKVIIVEFCSTGYQDILDKYIAGDNVGYDEVKTAWRETGQNIDGLWERPIYFNLLKKVREVNSTLPKEKRIRVLAGDPAIDWKSVNTREDYNSYSNKRDFPPAELAFEYGINRGQKVLIIYGGGHLRKLSDERKDSTFWTIPTLINKRKPGSIIIIDFVDTRRINFNEDFTHWPLYSLIDLNNNEIGNWDAMKYSWFYGTNRANDKEWLKPFEGHKIKDYMDALLFLGERKDMKYSEIPKNIFQDDTFWNELNRRNKIMFGEPLDESLRK